MIAEELVVAHRDRGKLILHPYLSDTVDNMESSLDFDNPIMTLDNHADFENPMDQLENSVNFKNRVNHLENPVNFKNRVVDHLENPAAQVENPMYFKNRVDHVENPLNFQNPVDLKDVENPVNFENPVKNPMANSGEKNNKRRISVAQKELMANFIFENPQLITHSSTKDNEIQLWNNLYQKLNDIKPVKSLQSWKKFLTRWKSQIMSKSDEISLTVVEYKMKLFLNQIITTNNNPLPANSQQSVKPPSIPKPTIGNVLEKIIQIEKERSDVRLEIDNNELKINKYRYLIHTLENENELKRARIKKLTDTKMYLNKRRRMLLLHGHEKHQDNCVIDHKKIKIENEDPEYDESET